MSSVAQKETIEVILTAQEALIESLRGLVTVFEEAAAMARGGESLETVLRDHFSDVLDGTSNLLIYDMRFRPTLGESAAAGAVLLAAARALCAVIGEPAPRQ
jgi:hypothetical protein